MSDNLRSAKFAVLDRVEKPVGYRYPGIVRSVYAKGDGEIRYDVEADHPDFAGMLHIFSEAQLTHRRSAPAPEAKDDAGPTKQEPNPEWEARYNEAHAKEVAELGVEADATLKMLETWKSDAEPANEFGQASFSRAMLESATDALRTTIAERNAQKDWMTCALREVSEYRALLVRAGEAMELGERLVDYFASNRSYFEGSGTPSGFIQQANALAAEIRRATQGETP